VDSESQSKSADFSELESELASLRQRLLRHARFAVSESGTAEDLVQDTLMAVVEHREQRRGDASLATWAIAILKNKIADWYRAPSQRRVVRIEPDDLALDDTLEALYTSSGGYAEPVPDWEQPENREEQRQLRSTLERCLSALPGQTGRVFVMREWLGFETEEICTRLGISAENCRTVLFRARTALRVCMQHRWIDARVGS
jgi:RNA polymerase sigma-70 factor (ECF subfamily)